MDRRQMDIDSYAPAQMAARVEKAGITKGNLDFLSTFALAVMAGVFIAFGAMLYTYVIHDSSLDIGLTKLIGGLVFCLGLILVIVAGADGPRRTGPVIPRPPVPQAGRKVAVGDHVWSAVQRQGDVVEQHRLRRRADPIAIQYHPCIAGVNGHVAIL